MKPKPLDLVDSLGQEEFPTLPDLVRDYYRGNRDEPRYEAPEWEAELSRALTQRIDSDFHREVLEYNRDHGANREALALWESLGRGEAAAVVAGQQPGLLGGPLYTSYKIATTLALVRELRKRLSVPIVPVYWNGGDDVDFHEIGSFYGYAPNLSTLQLSLPVDSYRPQTEVGSIGSKHLGSFLRDGIELLKDHPHPEALSGLAGTALAGSSDLGEFHTRFMLGLFRDQPLIVVDGRSATMRRSSATLFREALEKWTEVASGIEGRGKELEELGYHGQISAGSLGTPLFLIQDGVRAKASGEEGWRALRRAADAAPESLSPGVALRPLMRDRVLPTLAVVLGPAEIAYHLQLEPAYGALEIHRPVLYPRFMATYVPSEVCQIRKRTRIPWKEILTDPDEAVGRYSKRLLPTESQTPLRHLEEAVTEGKKYFGGIEDEEVRKLMTNHYRKMEGLLSRARDSLESHYRGSLPRKLRRLRNVIRPRDKIQERVMSAAMPLLIAGDSYPVRLLDLAGIHVRRFEERGWYHFIYTLEEGGWDCPEEKD